MRGLADAPLGRGEAELFAHRAVEKGVGLRRRRPHGFIKARQQQPVEAQQARLQQTENGQPRVACALRRRARRHRHLIEQGGVIGERATEGFLRRRRPFLQEIVERRAGAAGGERARRRQRRQRMAMRGDVMR